MQKTIAAGFLAQTIRRKALSQTAGAARHLHRLAKNSCISIFIHPFNVIHLTYDRQARFDRIEAYRVWTQCVQKQLEGTVIYEEDDQKISQDFVQVVKDALSTVREKYPAPKGLIEHHTARG